MLDSDALPPTPDQEGEREKKSSDEIEKQNRFNAAMRIRASKEEIFLESDEGHSWAISYADFLMTLLSFFILFFSLADKKDKDDLKSMIATIVASGEMEQIKTSLLDNKDEKKADAQGMAGTGGVEATARTKGFGEMKSDLFENTLHRLGIRIEQVPDDGFIILHFPDNLYVPGHYELTLEGRDIMMRFCKRIIPFVGNVELTFVGHTDDSPFKQSKKTKGDVKNNLDLSALRATNAVQFAIENGQISAEHISAKGSSFHKRKSRTLSVLVEPRNKVSKIIKGI